jgi:hypothetical protein
LALAPPARSIRTGAIRTVRIPVCISIFLLQRIRLYPLRLSSFEKAAVAGKSTNVSEHCGRYDFVCGSVLSRVAQHSVTKVLFLAVEMSIRERLED